MKLRKFYPSQVLRRLNGKHVDGLDSANQQALNIGLHRSRRAALAITICGGQIDVRNANELGRMILSDLRSAMPVFQFNESNVGHTLVFGPTGRGMSCAEEYAALRLKSEDVARIAQA